MGLYVVATSLALASSLVFAQGNSANHISATGAAHSRAHNVSRDLLNAINKAPGTSNARWVRDVANARLVQVIIVADTSSDKSLAALRRAIVQAGGSVHRSFNSVSGISALLPANKVQQIAARSDVLSIAPNRLVARTASLLENETGSADARNDVPGIASLDGTGVTIAVLDSGIMSTHRAFLGKNGQSRILARADLTPAASQDWTLGVDTSSLISVGSTTGNFDDPYGHGTLVASIAAGANAGGLLTNSTGVAPGASLVDVRVIDQNGLGETDYYFVEIVRLAYCHFHLHD